MFKACLAGAPGACVQLRERNRADLEDALNYMDRRYPYIMEEFDGDLPAISFDLSREFWAGNSGATEFLSGSIVLAAGYNSTGHLIATLAHEFKHSSDGILGRAQANFEDFFVSVGLLPPVESTGKGVRHSEIYLFSDEVLRNYQIEDGR